MQIKSYEVAMNSAHELTSLKRSGTAYNQINSSSSDASKTSLQSDENGEILTKIRQTQKDSEQARTDALTGKLAAGLLKRISKAVNAPRTEQNLSDSGTAQLNLDRTSAQTGSKFNQNGAPHAPNFTPDISSNLTVNQSSNTLYNSTGRSFSGMGFTSALRSFKEEEVSFSIKAQVQTSEKNIEVNLNVNLKRSFVELSNFSRAELGLSDPLVISLNGQMPNLSDEKFEFDIDSDGKMWQISKLREGSGFLALDKNENGTIDNGGELFGAKIGDGFKDQAKFDDDANGWIDKNDKIFSKLRIWQKTDAGDRLIALGESGIGAIFLGSVKSEFSLGNETKMGQLRSSGFFLKDSGEAGLITQIDLSKKMNLNLKNLGSLDVSNIKIGTGVLDMSKMNEAMRKIVEKANNLAANSQNFIAFAGQKPTNAFEAEMKQAQDTLKVRLNFLKKRLAGESVVNQKAIKSQIALLQRQISNIEIQTKAKI